VKVIERGVSSTYGPEANGLLCGFVFAADGQGKTIGLAETVQWLGQPRATQGPAFLWLHFSLTDAAAQRWMQAHLPLAPAFYEALREGSRSTRIEDAQDRLIAVVNDVAYEFSFDASQIATLWVDVGPQVAVTARISPSRSIDRLRQAVIGGARLHSPMALLNHLLSDQGDVLVRIVREASVRVDTIEDALLRGRIRHQRSELGQLRRVLVRIQRLLAPEPAALFRLLRQPPPWISARDLDEMRQATEEFSLVLRDLNSLQERIKLVQEEMAAQMGEQTNRNLFTLTVVTVLALPINITTGLFGMNVGGVPLASNPEGFLVIVLVVLVVTLGAAWFAFRRRD
jgi:zinc transporter